MVAIAKAVDPKEENQATTIIRRFDKAKGDRGTLDNNLQEVAERVLPRKSYVTQTYIKGKKRDFRVYDSTAVFANQYMASGLYAHLTPPNQRWFALKAKNTLLNKTENVRRWFMQVTRILHEELAASNYDNEINELYLDIGWNGTPCLEVKQGKTTLFNFKNHHISEYVIFENSDGFVDTVIRKFKYTARQAVQEWGFENLGKDVQDAYTEEKNRDKEFEFIHCIQPREEFDRSYPALKTKQPIASLYIDVKGKKFVKQDGYYEMPKMTPRWVKCSGDVYGRSQGMFALPEIKSANFNEKQMGIALEKEISPTILAPDDGFVGTVRTSANSIMYYRKTLQGKDKPEPFKTQANLNWVREVNNDKKIVIKKGFFNDLFVMLQEQTKTQTAYEIAQRIEEKWSMIIAPVGRLNSELNNPMIRRILGIAGRAGRLPAAPPELIGQEYEIEYVSKLALALKLLEVRSLTSGFEVMAPMMEIAPDMMDNYDTDEIARGIPERLGWSEDWLRDIEERDEIRQARELKAQQEQAQMMAIEAAKASSSISGPVDSTSVLSQIAGAA